MRLMMVLGLLLLLAPPGQAAADPLPSKNQGLLLLRILAYDHNLATRVDNKKVTIIVLHKAGTDSEGPANELTDVLREIAKSTKLAGNAVQIVNMTYDDKTFATEIAKTKAAALYLAPGLGDAVSTITAASQKRKLLTFTGVPDYVGAGVSLGFANDNGKPVISVNIPASKGEGADLDVALLRVAKIVKK